MTADLFGDASPFGDVGTIEALGEGAAVLRGHALEHLDAVLPDLRRIIEQAPLRHMVTPGGQRMSVAMTCCGALGWVTDRLGYRYEAQDPQTGRPWPALPASFQRLARGAADAAGFEGFEPDSCLVNRYEPGTRLSLHQDRDEHDYGAPIVSVSLGIDAVFLFGGPLRSDRARRVPLHHGDVVVWGGPARLHFHGVAPVKAAAHPLLGGQRINLTFRRAG